MTIYDAAMQYKDAGVPLLVIAGKEYGSGSSRDWAAKGTLLLGVQGGDRRELRAHPPQQPGQHGRAAAAVPGRRDRGVARLDRARALRHHRHRASGLQPGGDVTVRATATTATSIEFQAIARIDTPEELVAFRHGGILPYVLRQLVGKHDVGAEGSRPDAGARG